MPLGNFKVKAKMSTTHTYTSHHTGELLCYSLKPKSGGYWIICHLTISCDFDLSPPLLQAFGFCEYKEPESTLRALRLLHELLLGDKKLLVKVDAKTKAQLDEWKAKKKSANVVCAPPQ